jgi:glycerol-3-phosphate dehydrogenase subunit B
MSETTPKSVDVLVVGGGIEGHISALAAAEQDPSASVQLLTPPGDRFDYHPGLIDVLGYAPDRDSDEPVSDPFAALSDLEPEHPYQMLGTETVREALDFFDDAMDEYRGDHTDENALVSTVRGDIRPTSRYPDSLAEGLLSDARSMVIVGLQQLLDFDARLASERLDPEMPYEIGDRTVELPITIEAAPPTMDIAEAFDMEEQTEGGTPLREDLADKLRQDLDIEPRLGLPAMLGIDEHDHVRAAIESELQVDIFEVPTGPPHVPGIRLERELQEQLQAVDVAYEVADVTDISASDGSIERVETKTDPAYDPEAVVLATGGVDSGGIVADSDGVREPRFDCHVAHTTDREAWTAPNFLGDHSFAEFGVSVSEDLRPVDSTEEQEYENLRAVGRIIGGVDYDAQLSNDGVAIATGYLAGTRAVESP